MLTYSRTFLIPVSIYLFRVNNNSTGKQCEISPKLTKNPTKKDCLQDIRDSDIHSSSCEESGFSGSNADGDAEL